MRQSYHSLIINCETFPSEGLAIDCETLVRRGHGLFDPELLHELGHLAAVGKARDELVFAARFRKPQGGVGDPGRKGLARVPPAEGPGRARSLVRCPEIKLGASARARNAAHTSTHDAYQVGRRISHGVRTSMRFSYLYAYRIPGQARVPRFGMRFAYKYAPVHTQGSDLVCNLHTPGIRFAYKYAICIPRRSDLVCNLHIGICVLHTSMHGCIFRTRLCNKSFRRSGFSACRKSQFRQLRCCTALTCKDSGEWSVRGRGCCVGRFCTVGNRESETPPSLARFSMVLNRQAAFP